MREWDDESSGNDANINLEFGFWLSLAMLGLGGFLYWLLT